MKTDPNAPASTDMMGIVHSALRRDLTRTTTALTAAHPPGGAQRAALSAHVIWMMDFLHHHHRGEDDGLYPLVVSKNPAAEPLVRETMGIISVSSRCRCGSSTKRSEANASIRPLRVVSAPSTL